MAWQVVIRFLQWWFSCIFFFLLPLLLLFIRSVTLILIHSLTLASWACLYTQCTHSRSWSCIGSLQTFRLHYIMLVNNSTIEYNRVFWKAMHFFFFSLHLGTSNLAHNVQRVYQNACSAFCLPSLCVFVYPMWMINAIPYALSRSCHSFIPLFARSFVVYLPSIHRRMFGVDTRTR